MPQVAINVYRHGDKSVPLTKWLDELKEKHPLAFVKSVEAMIYLSNHGHEAEFPHVEPLRDAIYELRWKDGQVQCRIFYFFYDRSVVLSHGIIKKTRAVPPKEIDKAILHRKRVVEDPVKHLAEWEI
jgi:phage-related protein